ncbi:hypothetical protein CHARACLAT_017659 [Characodon lateralis]|uniref:Uncharacterized protein n=1 Tax=Characodon lateralis TaxID=208331 RepID=A0ABU7F3T5_9TELE|nr:hypothetical protein [Characodon lateralis]
MVDDVMHFELENGPTKNKKIGMMKALSCTVGRGFRGKLRVGCRLPPFLVFSLWGFCLVSRPCFPLLPFPSSSLTPLLALLVSSLSPALYPSVSGSQSLPGA